MVAGALTVASMSVASATTVTFGAGPDDRSLLDFGDFTVEASIGLIHQNGDGGLGVTSTGDSSNQVDGSNESERLTFVFDDVVRLTQIAFENCSGDNYQLFFDGVSQGTFNSNSYVGSTLLTSFAVEATQQNDNFRVRSITYTPAPVPLPAAGWMLLAGIGGIAAMKRRKKV